MPIVAYGYGLGGGVGGNTFLTQDIEVLLVSEPTITLETGLQINIGDAPLTIIVEDS